MEALGPNLSPPYWFKLTRAGNVFTGYRSVDGITWVVQGSAQVPMAATMYVGLAATSEATGTVTTATADNWTVTYP